ncbi:MAG: BirA family transcriptional regulator [Actinomycetota bacterium]|nr:BirA family transcriptional regulator [Actinomycetota bacterium]
MRRLAETDSTNRVVLEEARGGAAEGLVVVADHQTAGRGRLGRAWQAPPGASLLVTVLLRPALPPAEVHLVTIAAGLAAADACDAVTGVVPALKWPNDLVIEREGGTRKLAGLLSESLVAGGRIDALARGMGLNVQWPAVLPDELASIATALNHEAGHDVDREQLLDAWLERLGQRYGAFDAGSLLAEYRERCVTLGREVRAELAFETVTGIASDVDVDGHLLVDTSDGRRVITAGDVVHVRPA